MGSLNVGHYQAFSQIKNEGNPAGVVLDADHLSQKDMQKIAEKVGFNETVFILKPEKGGDYRLRFFTPGHETDLCGHGTMAATCCLIRHYGVKEQFIFETNVGLLEIGYAQKTKEIKMEQSSAKFLPFSGNVERLMEAIGLTSCELDSRYPIVYGHTGSWTLLIPMKNLASFSKMQPKNQLFSKILTEIPAASVHPFTFETYDNKADLHGRHFSGSFSGTKEDSVTGTASGVMGAYYIKEQIKETKSVSLLIEQGNEMRKPGKVNVFAEMVDSTIQVKISGVACFVKNVEIEY